VNLFPAIAFIALSPKISPDHSLDFWLGSWDVYVGTELNGTDLVEKVVGGFAVIENWKEPSGSTGKSLFYFMPSQGKWKQVWVTDVGVYKEKYSEPFENGIRFAGTVFLPDGRKVKDRTTLTKLPGGEVRQVIEFTKDGQHWQTSFDAVYKKAKKVIGDR